jgi:hypothetical protein
MPAYHGVSLNAPVVEDVIHILIALDRGMKHISAVLLALLISKEVPRAISKGCGDHNRVFMLSSFEY